MLSDKPVTQSITMVGGVLTLVLTSLIQFGVIPDAGSEAGQGIIDGLMEVARNIAALVTVFGLRKAAGDAKEAAKGKW